MRHRFIILVWLVSTLPLFAQLPKGIVDTQPPTDQPPSPAESLKKITVPEGFHVSLFAAEPNVAQPIAINYDDRGRLWVAESFSYIEWKQKSQDRILIFEDTDKDGIFDKRTVFWDKGNYVSGFQIGHGGVWVCDAPNLLFIPDEDHDDIPDGEPEIILDGWTLKAEHNVFNGLTWGPDGWLYGRHGIKKPSLVGKPGTPDSERTALSCSIWRFHPVRKTFEIYANGTINPWGLDWNEEGQAFITTSVIDHLWHLVPGARLGGRKAAALNPYTYDFMEPTSDHRHWTGGQTERKKQGFHDHAGGGHSHCGLMIYQADSWPEKYRGRAFFSNILGQRVNMDPLVRKNSGYTAPHGNDFLHSGSDWFRATDLKQGPYGEMMMAEWTDLGECHDRDGVHRTSGRLYQVSHGENPPVQKIDVAKMTTNELLGLLSHENVWWRRHALRNLYERATAGENLSEKQLGELQKIANTGSVRDAVISVQALYAMNPSGAWMESIYASNSKADRDAIRAQTIGLGFVSQAPTTKRIEWLESQISHENSALVQLWMTSALQRIPVEQRWKAATLLSEIKIDPSDRNLSLMRWYGFEPLVEHDPARAMKVALEEGHPYLSKSITRRAVSANAVESIVSALSGQTSSKSIAPILDGLLLALSARAEMPVGWQELYKELRQHSEESVKRSAFRLAHQFGDPVAEAEMVQLVMDSTASESTRKELMDLLVSSKSKQLGKSIPQLVSDPKIGTQAIRAMAAFPQGDSAKLLLTLFAESKPGSNRRSAILETLTARKDFADTLVEAFLAGKIHRTDIPAYLARQIASVSTKGKVFGKQWGLNPEDAKEKEKLIKVWKSRLNTDYLAEANPADGQQVFQKICAVCHQLYGKGGIIGPDLTGSNRANLDYFLINVLFPSEDVNDAYKLVTLTLNDGRTLSGNIVEENENVITFSQVGQVQRIDTADIASRTTLDISLMPQGLLDTISREDVRDLVGYLQTTAPLP